MALAVTNKHMYVQFIDDSVGRTLGQVSTQDPGCEGTCSVDGATKLGQRAADVAKQKGISAVVLDRGGHRYHARVKAIADPAREGGLVF